MTFQFDNETLGRVATLPEVREAAQAGAQLIELWPLADAKQMDNDSKYVETLQVRLTRMLATVMTHGDVTTADAEFVYEGADTIPGRPQLIVDALLAANEAYDAMADYSETADAELVMHAADVLAVGWNEETRQAVLEVIDYVGPAAGAADLRAETTSSEESVAYRFAAVLTVCDALFNVIAHAAGFAEPTGAAVDGGHADSHDSVGRLALLGLPVVLYTNELCERLSIPRTFVTAEELIEVLLADASGDETSGAHGGTLDRLAGIIAPLTKREWNKHREDVLWDPDEAKKQAKKEDERKNKEALSAKFAHVKDEPGKPHVEL